MHKIYKIIVTVLAKKWFVYIKAIIAYQFKKRSVKFQKHGNWMCKDNAWINVHLKYKENFSIYGCWYLYLNGRQNLFSHVQFNIVPLLYLTLTEVVSDFLIEEGHTQNHDRKKNNFEEMTANLPLIKAWFSSFFVRNNTVGNTRLVINTMCKCYWNDYIKWKNRD